MPRLNKKDYAAWKEKYFQVHEQLKEHEAGLRNLIIPNSDALMVELFTFQELVVNALNADENMKRAESSNNKVQELTRENRHLHRKVKSLIKHINLLESRAMKKVLKLTRKIEKGEAT